MIEVRINGYECDPGEIEIGTAGSYGVQQLHFAFSSEWEGLTRRTTWMTDAGKIAVLLDESDTMTVPAEATATAGRRWLSVDGVAAGKQMISVRMGYKVYETVEPGGENSVTPTDGEMTQALAILEEVKALKTPEITVGKTETVEAGTPARVENTGTATKAVLDFEIPRGESGVYVGTVEPDETAKVWVDPEGENDAEGAVIDLNAAVLRAAAYAEGGTAPATLIGNVSYPAIDTIGAKGYMDAAQAARASAEAAESGAIAAKTAAEAAVLNGPKIENNTWRVYDAAKQTYVDTGVEASGIAGQTGERGTGLLKVSTAPSSYTTAIGDYTPKYRIALDTVIAESGAEKVLVGDVIEQSYYHYVIDYLDDTYAYSSVTRTSIRGATGATGARGATGAQGVGVRDVLPVAESSESGGTNTFRVSLTNGDYTNFNYRNGKDGGYYDPEVTQPSENMMRLTYFPSQDGMGDIKVKDIALPRGARGATGAQGPQGIRGSNGKTAYQYAQDGGYTGSETEFAAKLAAEHLPVPATAAVGQYFRAKTVDENGLVTEVEAVDAPAGGGEAHFPKFELLHTHAVSEEESTSVAKWEFGLNEIPNLNDYNALNTVIRSPDGSEITLSAWVRFAINGTFCGMFCGSPNGKGSTYCVPANRLYGNWIAGYFYGPERSGMALVAKGARNVQETTIDASVPVTKISVLSYTSGFGMVAGTIIEIYGAK